MTSKTRTRTNPVPQKPKGGRPATGKDPVVTVRVPVSLLTELDAWRGRYGEMSRAVAIRVLMTRSLRAPAEAEVVDPKKAQGTWIPPKTWRLPHPEAGATPRTRQ